MGAPYISDIEVNLRILDVVSASTGAGHSARLSRNRMEAMRNPRPEGLVCLDPSRDTEDGKMVLQLLLLGLVAGTLGGMFGIGGGAIMVPVLVMLMGQDQKWATGTSLLAQLLPIGILGIGVYWKEGNIGVKQGLILAGGLVVGNLLGALFANQPWVSAYVMKKAYGVFLVAVGVRYLFL